MRLLSVGGDLAALDVHVRGGLHAYLPRTIELQVLSLDRDLATLLQGDGRVARFDLDLVGNIDYEPLAHGDLVVLADARRSVLTDGHGVVLRDRERAMLADVDRLGLADALIPILPDADRLVLAH